MKKCYNPGCGHDKCDGKSVHNSPEIHSDCRKCAKCSICGSSKKVSAAPAQASNYAEVREAWPRYIHKLCVPFNYQSFGNNSIGAKQA